MKRIFLAFCGIFFFIFLSINRVEAQADTIMHLCTQYLKLPFVSDGQQYKALLNQEETAEFRATFYGGNTYRIIACSGLSDGNLVFSLFDINHNLLFTNKDYKNTPYWDFQFDYTIDGVIEATLAQPNTSGFAIILIGFKKQ